MDQLDREHPLYGFKRHKGYSTEGHLEAIRSHGICKEHRKSFAPIQKLLDASVSICKALKVKQKKAKVAAKVRKVAAK